MKKLLRRLLGIDKERVYIKYFKDGGAYNKLKYTGDWVDVHACQGFQVYNEALGKFEDIPSLSSCCVVKRDTLVKIPLGFALQLPEGYEAIVKPRSSLSKNTGLIFATSGVIDEGYCGDNDQWFVVAYATRNATIYTGERIAQFRIQLKQPKLEFVEVEKLGNKDRGGHGSTGRF